MDREFDILAELRRPFHPSAVTWKPGAVTKDQTKALALAYADLRAYQNRLDEVCGMDWTVTYTPWGEKVICHLTIAGVTRSSSGEADSQSERSEIAGTAAEAQSFKRACAMFGLGRYLYQMPSVWVEFDANAKQLTDKAKAKLNGIVTQHYQRWMGERKQTYAPTIPGSEPSEQKPAPATETTVEQAEQQAGLLGEFERLGSELYGVQWEQVCRHNVERITAGQATEVSALTAEQIQKLVDGMKKLQQKRQAATGK